MHSTIIQQHGDIAAKPSQVFGNGETILRIGNGGAGGTGLVEVLAKDYLSLKGNPGSIEWICNHSRNTQLALLNGYVDIALTYEREQEEISLSEGWATSAGCIFHDHFCLVGPEHDPANVKTARSIEEAFDRIATTQSLFHSRSDGSATMCKDHEIWRRCHRFPWTDETNSWFVQTKYNPADAITVASARGAYILNDRSTLLNQVSRGTVTSATVFFEPTDPFHALMNSCYALHAPVSTTFDGTKDVQIQAFVDYLKSPRGQSVIAEYGRDKAGVSYFAPVSKGIVTPGLHGGKPRDRRWILVGQRAQKI